jgi:hypothetical protein
LYDAHVYSKRPDCFSTHFRGYLGLRNAGAAGDLFSATKFQPGFPEIEKALHNRALEEAFKRLSGQTAKEVPHPQVEEAFGLLNTNPRASKPVPQSISIPCRYMACAGFIMQGIPSMSS